MKDSRTHAELIEKAYQLGFDYEKKCRFFGHPYYIADPDEFAKFEAAGGHDDKCTEVVGRATRLAVQFILEQKLLAS